MSGRCFRLFALLGGLSGAVAGAAADMRFTDITDASGIDLTLTSGGTPSRDILEVNGGGVALFDYDGDGDLDAFFANGATLADPERGPGSRLYANAGDGTFRDVTESVGIALRRWAMGVAVGDYDGDGDEDLYVTCYGPNVLLRNDVATGGGFRDVTAEAGVGDARWGTSAAFGDFDRDSDLDLYVVNHLEFDHAHPPDRAGRMFLGVPVMAGPMGLVPQGDVLYENLGGGKFKDATVERGCVPKSPGYGLGVAVFDADGNGWLDIFVANDSTENFLFRNKGQGKFEEVGVVAGIASNYDGHNQASMGIAIGDVDGNGRPDVFTTVFSSDTNTLHLNFEGGFFEDRSSQYGLAMVSRPFLGWGTRFYDFDSDGDEDLFIANGHVYPEAATRAMDTTYEQTPLLFAREGKRFERVVDAGSMFRSVYSGRATAFGDLEGDGDVDIVMTTLNGKPRLFRNDTSPRDVRVVELRDARGSRHVEGGIVELVTAGGVQRRWLGGGSYQSVDAPAAHFGLGTAAAPAARLRVLWPGGQVTEHGEVPPNRKIIVREGKAGFEAVPLRGRGQLAPSASAPPAS